MPDMDRIVAGLRCRDLLTLLTDYVDGDLTEGEAGRVDQHLEGCSHCRKFGGEYGALVGTLRTRREEPVADREIQRRLTERMRLEWERAQESDGNEK